MPGILALALGCGEKQKAEPSAASVNSTRGKGSAEAATDGASATPRLWYDRSRLLDLTGDGRVDTLMLEALGTRSDSLTLRLRIRAEGKDVFEASWRSDYELIDPPIENPSTFQRDSLMRAQLDSVLARVKTTPYERAMKYLPRELMIQGSDSTFESAIAWDMKVEAVDWSRVPPDSVSEVLQAIRQGAYDTAKARAYDAEIRRRRSPMLELTYGYETYRLLAWSPLAGRYFTVFECC